MTAAISVRSNLRTIESDDEDYGFDYESGDDEFDDDDPEIVLQNTFYESKGIVSAGEVKS